MKEEQRCTEPVNQLAGNNVKQNCSVKHSAERVTRIG